MSILQKLSLGLICAAALSSTAAAKDVVVRNEHVAFGPNKVIDDLIIRRGGSVDLNGSTVRGDIIMEDESELYSEGAVIWGNIEVDFSRIILLGDTRVRGRIIGLDAEIFVDNTRVRGDIRTETSYVDLCCGAIVKGDLQIEHGDVYIEDIEVAGVAEIEASRQVEISLGWFRDDLWVSAVRGRIIVEETLFLRDVLIEDNNLNRIRVADNEIWGDLRVVRNFASNEIRLRNNIIDGDLRARNNNPDAVGINSNDVGGDVNAD